MLSFYYGSRKHRQQKTATPTTTTRSLASAPPSFGCCSRSLRPRSFPAATPLGIAKNARGGLAVTYDNGYSSYNNNINNNVQSIAMLLMMILSRLSQQQQQPRRRIEDQDPFFSVVAAAITAETQQFMSLSTGPLFFFLYYHRQQQQQQPPLSLLSSSSPSSSSLKKNNRRTATSHSDSSKGDDSLLCTATTNNASAAAAAATATATYDYFVECGGSPWSITKTVAQILVAAFWGTRSPALLWVVRLLAAGPSSVVTNTQRTTPSSVPVTESSTTRDDDDDDDDGIYYTTSNNDDGDENKPQEEEATAAAVADDPLTSAVVRSSNLSKLSVPEGEKNLPGMNAAVLPLSWKEAEIAVADAGSTNEEKMGGTLESPLPAVLGAASHNNTSYVGVSSPSSFNPQQKSTALSGESIRTGGGWWHSSWVDAWGFVFGNLQNILRKQLLSVTLEHMILLHAFLFWSWMTYLATVIVLDYTLSHQQQHHHHHYAASTH